MPAEPLTKEEQDEHESKHPPLPGNKVHVCTDPMWLVFFLVCVAFAAHITHYATVNGDHRKLSRGYNKEKQLCGFHAGVVDTPYLFYCRDIASQDFVLDDPICVASCPHQNLTADQNETNACPGGTEEYDSRPLGHWCLPLNKGQVQKVTTKITGENTASHLVSTWRDIRNGAPLFIPANVILAILVGYLYLYLLNTCAEYLVYVCELVLVAGTMGLGGWILEKVLMDGLQLVSLEVDLLIGSALCLVGFFMFCLFCCKNQSVGTAVGCIQAACECLVQEPMLLIEPLISIVFKIAVLGSALFGLAQLVTTGQIHLPGENGIRRDFTYTQEQWLYLGFYIFMIVWVTEMMHSTSQYVLAWTTQMWYFTPYVNGRKVDKLSCGVFKGLLNALRYHLGTIAFGSLLIAYLRVIRVAMAVLAKAASAQGNAVGVCLAKSCVCCLTCFTRFLEFLTKNAYMDVAITSSNFCPAAGRAQELLMSEVPAVAVLNGTQFIFQVCGIGLVTSANIWLTLIVTTKFAVFTNPKSTFYMSSSVGVCFVAGMIGAFIASGFMSVFDTVGDTILYCFASEQRRRSSRVDQKAYRTQKTSPSMYSWVFGEEVDDDEPEHVDYAPRKLKELIEGNGHAK